MLLRAQLVSALGTLATIALLIVGCGSAVRDGAISTNATTGCPGIISKDPMDPGGHAQRIEARNVGCAVARSVARAYFYKRSLYGFRCIWHDNPTVGRCSDGPRLIRFVAD
jgi:hypothetical protein